MRRGRAGRRTRKRYAATSSAFGSRITSLRYRRMASSKYRDGAVTAAADLSSRSTRGSRPRANVGKLPPVERQNIRPAYGR